MCPSLSLLIHILWILEYYSSLLGRIVDKTGNYKLLFYAIAFPSIAGAVTLLGLRCIKSGPFSTIAKENLVENHEDANGEPDSVCGKERALLQYESSF